MDETLQSLLQDAKLVAAHGARAGQLPDGALASAIAKAEAAPAFAWSSPDAAALQTALAAAIEKVKPVTLFELKEGWKLGQPAAPFPHPRWWVKMTVLAATLALIVICASLTNWQGKVTTLLNEYAQEKASLQRQAVHELIPLVAALDQEDQFKQMSDPASVARVALRGQVTRVLERQRAMEADARRLQQLTGTHPLFAFDFPGRISPPASRQRPATGPVTAEEADDKALVLTASADAQPWEGFDPDTRLDGCLEGFPHDGTAQFTAVSDIANFVPISRHEVEFVAAIQCILGIDDPSIQNTYGVQPLSDGLAFMSVWLLPALYGLLGALIYHLRSYLSSSRPDPAWELVLMRVALGGFAGIAIGWFWNPEGDAALGTADFPLGLLTVAFLVGFAIDVFLALLDRIVTLLYGWVASMGAAAPR